MSIPVLVEVYDEMRRLAIAGSTVAPGDFRLKRLVAPLEKAGEKAPVFAKVGQAVQAVVDSNEKTAAVALLELTTLVNAILYTQGESGIAGDFKPLETTQLGGQTTQASARVLKPLMEALSSTGSGRLELIKDACERGTFKDLRLVKPALNAIDDPYPEIGDLISTDILPLYGKAILPELRSKIDIKGRAGHVNRLQLMHKLDPEGSRDLIKSVLNDGSKEMKVAAVECLGTGAEDVAYLLEQAKAKAQDVRAAALRALMAMEAMEATVAETLKKAIAGKDLELFIPKVKTCKLPLIQEFVLEQAEKQFEESLKCKDAKKQGPAIERLQQLALCLGDRADEKAEAFLLRCFNSAEAFAAIKSEPSGTDLNELIGHLMSKGTPKMRQQLVANHKTLGGEIFSAAIYAARSLLSPAAFYEDFSPLLKRLAEKGGKKNSADYERAQILKVMLTTRNGRAFYRRWLGSERFEERGEVLRELDPRWLDVALAVDSPEMTTLVCAIARPGHAETIQFLSEQLKAQKKPHEATELLQAMIRIGHPGATEAVIDALKRAAKDTYFYASYWYGRMIPDLPRSAYAKFEELLPTLPDKMVDQLMESILTLKNKPE